MKVYFTSDTHYFHGNIIKYCSRPFSSTDEMNESMVKRWNEVVRPDDVGIHVGDVSAGLGGRSAELRTLIGNLNGLKILIRGNHDHLPNDWYTSSGFIKVFDHLNLGGVLLTHFPLHELVKKVEDLSTLGIVEHVIHGHVHRTDTPEFELHYNVAADRNNFTPISLEKVVPVNLCPPFIEAIKIELTNK
jgi:calcineurin-like phosphoesterase family protein